MAVILAEAFNTYDDPRGLGNSLEKVGYAVFSSVPAHLTFRSVDGRRVLSYSRTNDSSEHRAHLRKQIPLTADFAIGVAFRVENAITCLRLYSHFPILCAKSDTDLNMTNGAGVYYDDVAHKFFLRSTSVDTYIEVPGITPTLDTWYYFELEFVGGDVNLYVDDVLMASTTQDTSTFQSVEIGSYSSDIPVQGCDVYFTDFYCSNSLAPNAGRLGPIEIVPLIPAADGTEITGFSATPPGALFETVNDHAGNSGTDSDTSFASGVALDSGFSVTCTAERPFTGNAIGYFVNGVSKAASPTGLNLEYVITDGANEVAAGDFIVTIPDYTSLRSDFLTALPGGVDLSQANFEAMEFGLRLKIP